MARLRQLDGPGSWLIPAQFLIGRSPACALRLAEVEVSREHALIRWRHESWEILDLQSRNGTYVDGHRIEAGPPVPLRQGASLGFGKPHRFVLAEAGAPQAHALKLDDSGDTVESTYGLLTLPDPATPELVIYSHSEAWWLEQDSSVTLAADGQVVSTSAGLWRLHLPTLLPATNNHLIRPLHFGDLTLQFSVHDADRPVELVARADAQVFDFKARAHHLPLLLLAHVRLADRHLPAEQQGWIHQEVLLERLQRRAGHLNLDIHKIRREFAEAGIPDAGRIVERRPGTGQLRIGTSLIEIHAPAAHPWPALRPGAATRTA